MKFLEKYRIDILKAFEDCGFSKSDFQFVKRKGRIVTEHKSSEQKFSFIIRKRAEINEATGQFENVHHFEAQHGGSAVIHCPYWPDVVTLYKDWLVSLR